MSFSLQADLGYPRLKSLYAMFCEIPVEAVNLDAWQAKTGKTLHCGTVCCLGGWACHYPKFQAEGLGFTAENVPAFGEAQGVVALGAFFGIKLKDSLLLFGTGTNHDTADKVEALERITDLLYKLGAITYNQKHELDSKTDFGN